MGQKAGFYIILFQQFINSDCSVWTDTHSVSAALPQTALDIADILICQVIWQHSHNDAGKTASMNSAGAPLLFCDKKLCKSQRNGNSLLLNSTVCKAVLKPFPGRIAGSGDIFKELLKVSFL